MEKIIPKLNFQKIKNKNILNTFKDFDTDNKGFQTERITNSKINNGLCHTFKMIKEKILTLNMDPKSYIYDLENTMSINLNIISNILPTVHFQNSGQRKKLNDSLKRINILYNKKLNLYKSKENIINKILSQNKINDNINKKNKQIINTYQKDMEQMIYKINNNLNLIKKKEKKFKEIENFIIREYKNDINYNKIINNLEILTFIKDNENLKKKKLLIDNKINNLKKLNEKYKSENKILKENLKIKKINFNKKLIKNKDLINYIKNNNQEIKKKIFKLNKLYINLDSNYNYISNNSIIINNSIDSNDLYSEKNKKKEKNNIEINISILSIENSKKHFDLLKSRKNRFKQTEIFEKNFDDK